MSSQLQIKGLIMPPSSSCSDGCAGSSAQGCTFDLAFRNCFEVYQQVRQGKISIATLPNVFVDLAPVDQLSEVQLLAVQSSGPVKLRINGAPASAESSAVFPVAGLTGLTLIFTVDTQPLTVTFEAGDDTATDVARRINAAAALAGLSWQPASVTTAGQVEISGALTGAQGSLSAITGTASAALGFAAFAGEVGTGADVDVDGLFVTQFPRGALSATRVEVSGTATLSVLAAGT